MHRAELRDVNDCEGRPRQAAPADSLAARALPRPLRWMTAAAALRLKPHPPAALAPASSPPTAHLPATHTASSGLPPIRRTAAKVSRGRTA